IDLHIAADGPAELLESLPERRSTELSLRIVLRVEHQHADAPHLFALLRPHRQRPRRRSAAEQRDELAAPHSITSSVSESSDGGNVRPSILAVSALMTSSNFADCTTGSSAGLAPLRIRPQ